MQETAEADISTRRAAIMGKASGGLDRSRGGISEKYGGSGISVHGRWLRAKVTVTTAAAVENREKKRGGNRAYVL